MKQGWTLTTLGEICLFDKVQGIWADLPYVGLEDIEPNTGKFIGTTEPQEVKSTTFRFTKEHVLYGRLRPYLNKALAPNFEGHCSTEIFPIKPSADVLRAFLLYWLLSNETCQRVNDTCTGARMPRAQMNIVLGFDFLLPPLPEQRRIVAILDQAFAAIATARAHTEQNLRNARELFESQLAAVFSQQGAGWVETTLGKVCAFDKVQDIHLDLPYVGMEQIEPHTGKFLGSLDAQTVKSTTFKFTPDHVLYGRLRPYLNKALAPDFEGHCSTEIFPIKPKAPLLREFLLHWLLSPEICARIDKTCTGARMPRAQMNEVLDFDFLLPPLSEQRNIVTQLDAMTEQSQTLQSLAQRKLAALDELKQSLLQQAFSGQL